MSHAIFNLAQLTVRSVRVGLVTLAVVSFLLATTGVMPNPGVIIKKLASVRGEAYPCQGGRCMCASARECWTSCRCHTLQQKVAWAEREGVEVPAYVDLSALDRAEPDKPACPLCRVADADLNEEETVSAREHEPTPMPTLTAMGCKGLQMMIAFGAIVGVPVAEVVIRPPNAGISLPSVVEEQRFVSRKMEVPTPPPRRTGRFFA